MVSWALLSILDSIVFWCRMVNSHLLCHQQGNMIPAHYSAYINLCERKEIRYLCNNNSFSRSVTNMRKHISEGRCP